MSRLDELIDAHRRAYEAFDAAVVEQEEADKNYRLNKQFMVESLLSPEPGECSYWGKDYDEAKKRLWDHYNSLGVELWWLKRADRELFDRVSVLLNDMQKRNRVMVHTAWRRHQKDKAAAKARFDKADACWRVTNEAEKQAAIALLRYPCVDREEERKRAEYIKQSKIMDGADDIYIDALWQSFIEPPENETVYPPAAAIEIMHGGVA